VKKVNQANDRPTIDDYIATFPAEVQAILQRIRATIREAAPEAEEAIKYGIPTFTLHGNLVHFGGYKSHVGFYPAPSGIEAFQDDLARYQSGRGTLRFPLDEPIPYQLITRVVRFRIAENQAKAGSKKKRG
jgi:uncharacterized protein YdhG (YjbR/CyaY superfamily)